MLKETSSFHHIMIAASQCKATIVDEKYYKQLLSKYDGDILSELTTYYF